MNGTKATSSRLPAPRRRSFGVQLRRDWPLLLMITPALLLVFVFHYVPTFGNVIAFQDYNPFEGDNAFEAFIASEWIGFGNFQDLFESPAFWDALRNTLAITLFQLVFFFPLPIALAIMLHSLASARLRTFIQGVVYLPAPRPELVERPDLHCLDADHPQQLFELVLLKTAAVSRRGAGSAEYAAS